MTLSIILVVVIIWLLAEFIHMSVFGNMHMSLPAANLEDYQLTLHGDMLFHKDPYFEYNYISYRVATPLTKWHIAGYGCILRGSKAHKRIEAYYKSVKNK